MAAPVRGTLADLRQRYTPHGVAKDKQTINNDIKESKTNDESQGAAVTIAHSNSFDNLDIHANGNQWKLRKVKVYDHIMYICVIIAIDSFTCLFRSSFCNDSTTG
jgi:hypothetical protein